MAIRFTLPLVALLRARGLISVQRMEALAAAPSQTTQLGADEPLSIVRQRGSLLNDYATEVETTFLVLVLLTEPEAHSQGRGLFDPGQIGWLQNEALKVLTSIYRS